MASQNMSLSNAPICRRRESIKRQIRDTYKNYCFIILLTDKPVLLFIAAFIFIALGLLCLITARQKISFMERRRRKGTAASRNYSRIYFLFPAAVIVYYGVLAF